MLLLSFGFGKLGPHGFAALSLPIGIHTHLMARALGALSKVCSGLATGFCSAVGCGTMTGAVIMMQDIIFDLLGHGHNSILDNS